MRLPLIILFLTLPFSGISQRKVRVTLSLDCEYAQKHRFDSIIIEDKTYAYTIFHVDGNPKLDTAANFGNCWVLLKDFSAINVETKKKIAKELFSKYAFLRVNLIEDCEVRTILYQARYPTEAEKKKLRSGRAKYYFKDVL